MARYSSINKITSATMKLDELTDSRFVDVKKEPLDDPPTEINIEVSTATTAVGIKEETDASPDVLSDVAMLKLQSKPECKTCKLIFTSSKDMETHMCGAHQSDTNLKGVISHRAEEEEDLYDGLSLDLKCDTCVTVERYSDMSARRDACDRNSKVRIECEDCRRLFETVARFNRHRGKCRRKSGIARKATSSAKSTKVENRRKRRQIRASKAAKTCDKDLKCNNAANVTKTKTALKLRRKRCVGNAAVKKQTFSCERCSKVYVTLSRLQLHVNKIHEQHKCAICDKNDFDSLQTYRRHMNQHTGLKPYLCENCGLSFLERTNLRQHMTIHTGVLPHQCDVCSKRFRQKNSMKRHKVLMHEPKPKEIVEARMKRAAEKSAQKSFQCDHCPIRFDSRSGLNRHVVNTHSGKAPSTNVYAYDCLTCGKTYGYWQSVRRHALAAHKITNAMFRLRCRTCATTIKEKLFHPGKLENDCPTCFAKKELCPLTGPLNKQSRPLTGPLNKQSRSGRKRIGVSRAINNGARNVYDDLYLTLAHDSDSDD